MNLESSKNEKLSIKFPKLYIYLTVNFILLTLSQTALVVTQLLTKTNILPNDWLFFLSHFSLMLETVHVNSDLYWSMDQAASALDSTWNRQHRVQSVNCEHYQITCHVTKCDEHLPQAWPWYHAVTCQSPQIRGSADESHQYIQNQIFNSKFNL